MAASGEVAINQHLYKDKMSYDPPRELVAVALIGIVPCVVVVATATPVRTAAELIAYARANRGRLSFSSSGIGNPQHLAGELMNSMAGTDVLHVPYRGIKAVQRSPDKSRAVGQALDAAEDVSIFVQYRPARSTPVAGTITGQRG